MSKQLEVAFKNAKYIKDKKNLSVIHKSVNYIDQEFINRLKRHAYSYARKINMPASIDSDDLVNQAICVTLENQHRFINTGYATFYTFITPYVQGEWSKYISKMYYSPTPAMKSYWKKKGIVKNDYGEVSIELFVNENGDLPFFEGSGDSISLFFNISLEESAGCIKECLAIIKEDNDNGISFAKSRGKYHVEVSIMGKKQFIGQYLKLEEAKKAKTKFIYDFMDAVLDAA